MHVIVLTGDGDCSAIGGNHLIHAARRNIGMTVVVLNNSIYGMTGGQYSPTTPTGDKGTTAPYGNLDRPFDIALLAAGAGASFTARGTTFHVDATTKLIMDTITHPGFSLVDVWSVCPTYYGRKNRKGSAVDMLTYQRDHAVPVDIFNKMNVEEQAGRFAYGILTQNVYPELTERYAKLTEEQYRN